MYGIFLLMLFFLQAKYILTIMDNVKYLFIFCQRYVYNNIFERHVIAN